MLHRSNFTTIKVKNLDTIHLKEPRHLPENIRLVPTIAQLARNPFSNQMEGSNFTPVNTPKAVEVPKSPTSSEKVMSSIVAKPNKAASKASEPEESSTPNVAIKPKKASRPSTPKEAAMPSTPIQSKKASTSSSSGGSKTSTIAIKPKAGPQSTSSVESGTSAFKIELEDLTNRNKISVASLQKALTERGLDVDKKETRPILTVRLILCMSKLGLDCSNTVLQSRVAELLSFRMPQLKARLTQLNADAKGTNKVELIERILEAEQALAQTSGDDAGDGSSGSSPTQHGGYSTTPSSGADRNRRGSSTPTPASSNVSSTAGKVGGSKKRRRTEDADDADDEKEKPKSTKRKKTQDARLETVGELPAPPVQNVPNVTNGGGLDEQDMDMSDAPSDREASAPPTDKAGDVEDGLGKQVIMPDNQDGKDILEPLTLGAIATEGEVDTVQRSVSSKVSRPATVDPEMVDPEAESEMRPTNFDTPNVPENGKKRKSAATTDASAVDTDPESKQHANVVRPKASVKGKKPQKPAQTIPDGGAAEAESKKRKRGEPTAGNADDVNTEKISEKPQKRLRVTDDEAENTEDGVGSDPPKVLEELQQQEEPTKLEETTKLEGPKQSEKRKHQNDYFVFNGTLDTRVLFEDTVVPPKILNSTSKIMTGCGNMDDVNIVHGYRLGLKKYQKSHEPDHDPQKKGMRKWWTVQTLWEGKVSGIELSSNGNGQPDVDDRQSDAGNGQSMVNGEQTDDPLKHSNIYKVQPKFDNVDDEIMYDCTEGETTGEALEAFNQRIKERDDPAKNAKKRLRKIESVWLDMIYPPGSFSLDAYYMLLWKPKADEGMSKEQKLELREKEKAMMKLTGMQVASEKFWDIRSSHDRRW